MQNQRVGGSATIQACTPFNRGFCRVENDHVANGVLYPSCCSICLKETGKKFDYPLKTVIIPILGMLQNMMKEQFTKLNLCITVLQ